MQPGRLTDMPFLAVLEERGVMSWVKRLFLQRRLNVSAPIRLTHEIWMSECYVSRGGGGLKFQSMAFQPKLLAP